MKVFKILVILTVLLLVAGIALLVFSIHARLTASEYQFQVDAVLAAASVANQGEPLTDPDKAVISEYDGKKTVIVPGNYTALSYYLRKDAYTHPFLNVDRQNALKITVCSDAVFYAVPVDDSGDKVVIRLETNGNVFQMHTDGGNQWTSLLECCTKGTYHDDNIPLE